MFRVSCFGLRVQGLGFQVSVSGLGFRFLVACSGFRVSGFGSRVSGFGFRVSGFEFTAQVAHSRFCLPDRRVRAAEHSVLHRVGSVSRSFLGRSPKVTAQRKSHFQDRFLGSFVMVFCRGRGVGCFPFGGGWSVAHVLHGARGLAREVRETEHPVLSKKGVELAESGSPSRVCGRGYSRVIAENIRE